MVLSKRAANTVVGAICLVFIALRLFRLTDSCLWFDEIFGIHAAGHSWNSILQFVALDLIHPPLFYVLLKVWIVVGGEGLFWVRLLPVVFSIIAIFPFISLCRELKLGFWTRILALFFFAINGSLIKYAQEVRMYSLLLCLSLFSMWLFARYFVKGKSFIPLVVLNILLVSTHYFGWFVVGAEVAAILIFQRIKWRRIMTMLAVTFVSFMPWAYAVWRASQTGSELGQNIGWMTRPGVKNIGQFALNLIEPFYYQASTADPISVFRVSLPILLIGLSACAMYLIKWKQRDREESMSVKLLILFSVLPVIAALAASWVLPYSVWGIRHLIIVFAPVSIMFAIVVAKIPIPGIRTAALTLILLFSGYAFILQSQRAVPQYIWCAWDDVAREFSSKVDERDIYVFEDLVAYHLWFALRNGRDANVIRVTGTQVPNDDAYFLPRGFHSVRKIGESEIDGDRISIAFRAAEIDAGKPPISILVSRGYEIVEILPFPVGTAKAYLCVLERR